MQCKGDFEYPEGENWPTTAEAQKPSVAPKSYPIYPQTLTLAFKALEDLATQLIPSPMPPFHIPTMLNCPLLLRYPFMLFPCSSGFLCLEHSDLHQRIYKCFYSDLKARSNVCSFHKHLFQK